MATREYKRYVVNMDIKLGGNSPLGDKIYQGTVLEFDGLNARTDDGTTATIPFLKGAIQKGWIVLESEYDENEFVVPVAAPMSMGPTQHTGNSTAPRKKAPVTVAEEDSRQVSSVKDRTESVKRAADERHTARRVTASAGAYATEADGEVVRKVRTPAKTGGSVEPATIESQIHRASSASIKPEFQARPIRASNKYPIVSGDQDASIVISTGKKTSGRKGYKEVEGILFPDTSEGQEEAREEAAPAKKASLPATTVSPQEAKMRLKMAKANCQDFPDNYDFALPAKKKLARMMADFEDRPDVIQAIWLAETDDFKAVIASEFPEVFQDLILCLPEVPCGSVTRSAKDSGRERSLGIHLRRARSSSASDRQSCAFGEQGHRPGQRIGAQGSFL